MSLSLNSDRIAYVGVPRASGDEPDVLESMYKVKTCSPRERG